MHSWHLLPYGLFAVMVNALSTSSSSSESVLVLSGSSEAATPTGSYLSYASTITESSSALTTSALLSTVTSGSTTITTTLGSETIFGTGTLMGSNTSALTTSTTNSQYYLTGSARSSTVSGNSTANATSTSTAAQATNTTPCNNYAEFCTRNYGNITEVSAHNSPFIKTGNAAANQALSVTTQLNDGIRLLQAQIQWANNTPHFCHTSCDILDAGPITTYLGEVYDWVSTHPYDVVTILLGNGNYSNVELYAPYLEETGLVQYAYLPPKIPMSITDWPTLGSMILSGKRVIFFMDYQANQTSVPYVLDEFSQMWETPFDPTNASFPCTIQRPPTLSSADATSRLYMTNHNLNYDITLLGESLLVPNIPLLNVTNSNGTAYGTLGLTAQTCNDTWNYPPKFLNVDFYNVGNGSVFDVAAKYNNVTCDRQCCGTAASAALGINEIVGRSAILLAACVVGVSVLLL